MIVINARGARDVKALRRLATELQATSMSTVETDIAPHEVSPASQRRGRRPSVSTLPAAAISIQTQTALFNLKSVEIEDYGEYDLR